MASMSNNSSNRDNNLSKTTKQSPTEFSDGIDSIANKGTEALNSSMEYYKDIDEKAIDALKEIAVNTDDRELQREIVEEIKQIHNDAYTVQDKQAERVIEKEKTSFDYKALLIVLLICAASNPDALTKLTSTQSGISLKQFKDLPNILKSLPIGKR